MPADMRRFEPTPLSSGAWENLKSRFFTHEMRRSTEETEGRPIYSRQDTAKLRMCGEIPQLTEAPIVACKEQQEAAGATNVASEERMQRATQTCRLQDAANLGVCSEMQHLTEATNVACGEQREAAGAKTMASDERKKTATKYRNLDCAYKRSQQVTGAATTTASYDGSSGNRNSGDRNNYTGWSIPRP